MSNVYSASRPLQGNKPQTPQFSAMENYAYSSDVQDLLQKLLTDTFTEQPQDPLEFMVSWLQKEQKRRQDGAPPEGS